MRRPALPVLLLLLALLPAPALASGGGATAPSKRSHWHAPARPKLAGFRLTRPHLFLYGRPAKVNYRIESRLPTVRVRLYVQRPGARGPVRTIFLGEQPTGRTVSYSLTGREDGILPGGLYTLRIAARDRRGRRLRRAPATAASAQLRFLHHRLPLAGPFSYSGKDGRFGAKRKGHRHQGQDLPAAEGTPIVAPRGGRIEYIGYQKAGAGHYAVLDGAGEDRSYVFMHMRTGSLVVRKGDWVRTGQRIGEVGSTGESTGAHLHFEVWVGGWQTAGGRPTDPLPLLRSWDRFS